MLACKASELPRAKPPECIWGDVLPVLRGANLGFVSLANNHILDFNAKGLLDTMQHLDVAGIRHAGAAAATPTARTPQGSEMDIAA